MAEVKEINKNEELSQGDAQRLDAIKSLLFGENMEEYDHKFHDLFDKLEQYHTEFEERMKKLHRQHQKELTEMTTKFESEMRSLEKEIRANLNKLDDNKSDRRALSDMLKNVAEQLVK